MSKIHHTVHFWLKPDVSDDRRAAMLAALKGLAESPNVTDGWVGTPLGTDRAVVDNSYDFQLFTTHEDQAAADAYQSPDDTRHMAFIENYKDIWTKVLIYDAIEA
jgi:hypothetical protein